MGESENLAGWLMLSCLSLFIATMVVVACMMGIYAAEARHYTTLSGERSTVLDEFWSDFGPRKPMVVRRKPVATALAPVTNP